MYSHASRTPVVNVTRPQQARLPVLLLIVPILILFTQCTSHTPSVNDIQGPPRMTETIQKAPAVPWCEIVRKPSAFDKTVVRTRALLHVDHENQFLYDATCENEPTAPVWVEYDPSYVYSDEGVKRQLTELIKPTRTRSAGTALVTVVGRFAGPPSGPYGHLDGYPSEFSIIRIERAEQGESVAGKLR
jgi:hypothetical protein